MRVQYVDENRNPCETVRRVGHTWQMLLFTCLMQLIMQSEANDRINTGDHTVFTQTPAPEELAGILYPLRYRSIETSNEATVPTARFGLIVNFAFDSAKILPESFPLLESVGEMMGIESVVGKGIVIEGHTDTIGSYAYNQKLSERRAIAIKQHLIDYYGIAANRVITVGKGERDLYEKARPTAAINRRASFRPAS